MKIGIAIPPKLTVSEQVEEAKRCDEQGLALWAPDERFMRDVFVSMTAMAAATSRSTIGTGVTDAFIRHPLLTAAATATLDEISGGRAILGLGAGVSGFDALGIKRIAPATAVREMIEVCRRFWAGEKIEYEGKLVQVHGAHLDFPARQIPIYVAGRGERILAVGGQHADGVIIGHFTSAEGIGHSMRHIDEGLVKRKEHLGKPELALWAYTSVSEDGNAARKAVKPAIGRTIRSTPGTLDIFGVKAPDLMTELERFGYSRSAEYDVAMQRTVSDELTGHLSISGTPRECAARIQAIRDCGVGQVIALPYPAAGMSSIDMLAMLRREVMPLINHL
jgi:5,10-methylenetetrahydromethanopterin reductase